MAALTSLDLPFNKVASGKVRDLYEIPGSVDLLFVTSDRISCFDVVLKNGIPEKGAILNQMTDFWFRLLMKRLPSLHTHFVSLGVPRSLEDEIAPEKLEKYRVRSMIAKRLTTFPIESIVRGYLTGSAWSSYKKDRTVHGIKLREGLQESEKLDEPIWTPSTKAEQGASDENISPEEAREIIRKAYPGRGLDYATEIERLSLDIYKQASDYAKDRGIIIADTKFEFGLDQSTDSPAVILIDEVLTPDSSRFWNATRYTVGQVQASLDKQYVRDWLIAEGLKGKEGVELPEEVVAKTSKTYKEAYELLTGEKWSD